MFHFFLWNKRSLQFGPIYFCFQDCLPLVIFINSHGKPITYSCPIYANSLPPVSLPFPLSPSFPRSCSLFSVNFMLNLSLGPPLSPHPPGTGTHHLSSLLSYLCCPGMSLWGACTSLPQYGASPSGWGPEVHCFHLHPLTQNSSTCTGPSLNIRHFFLGVFHVLEFPCTTALTCPLGTTSA